MRIVLDTNVFVSRLVSAHGFPARIFRYWQDETFEVLVSPAMLEEYARVLRYPRLRRHHGLAGAEIPGIVQEFRRAAIMIDPGAVPDLVKEDPSDNVFLAVAEKGGAEYIVSGDRHLLDLAEYRGIHVLSPAAFVTLLERMSEA